MATDIAVVCVTHGASRNACRFVRHSDSMPSQARTLIHEGCVICHSDSMPPQARALFEEGGANASYTMTALYGAARTSLPSTGVLCTKWRVCVTTTARWEACSLPHCMFRQIIGLQRSCDHSCALLKIWPLYMVRPKRHYSVKVYDT